MILASDLKTTQFKVIHEISWLVIIFKHIQFHLYGTFYWSHPLMVVIICGKYGNNRSRTENVTERTRFSKSSSNDFEDIGQGQRSSHVTHPLMLVIICAKYGKNPSRTVDAKNCRCYERTQFSRPRPNDLEDIGQDQRSLYATHPLTLVIICAKYGKNPSRTIDATERTRFSKSKSNDLEDSGQG